MQFVLPCSAGAIPITPPTPLKPAIKQEYALFLPRLENILLNTEKNPKKCLYLPIFTISLHENRWPNRLSGGKSHQKTGA